jgi:hypothetical protein
MSLDIAAEKIIESEGTPSIAQSIFNMTGLYQRIVASPRNPFPRYIAIVSIDPSSEKHSVPSSHNVCAQREFLARLIERIAIASPDVIVVDKDFLPDECDENASELLVTVVQRVSQTIPIVVGRTLVESHSDGFRKTKSFDFSLPTGSLFFEGITNLDPDTRRLPLELGWPSIALSAAYAHDPNFVNSRPRLQTLIDGQPPFLSFLSKFGQHPSLGVLCSRGSIQDTESWRSCVKEDPTPNELTQIARELSFLRSKIVVVGEVSDEDMHGSVLGRIPGFELQANFIEALLDDRYFAPACWADYLLGFLVFVLLELILAWEVSVWRVILQVALLILVMTACVFMAVIIFQVYINPVPVSVSAIVVKLGILLSDRIRGRHSLEEDAPVHVARSLAYVAVTVTLITLWTVFCPGPRHIEGRAATAGLAAGGQGRRHCPKETAKLFVTSPATSTGTHLSSWRLS